MTAPELVSPDWEPGFVDYFYLSFTNATAFSPTDTLPLSRWAKLTMMLQSAISLLTVALVVARAVNILNDRHWCSADHLRPGSSPPLTSAGSSPAINRCRTSAARSANARCAAAYVLGLAVGGLDRAPGA